MIDDDDDDDDDDGGLQGIDVWFFPSGRLTFSNYRVFFPLFFFLSL